MSYSEVKNGFDNKMKPSSAEAKAIGLPLKLSAYLREVHKSD
tara:strand:- start:720 stop:845 length:126 start_codon:yes stop_codon:yes gene_type:complete